MEWGPSFKDATIWHFILIGSVCMSIFMCPRVGLNPPSHHFFLLLLTSLFCCRLPSYPENCCGVWLHYPVCLCDHIYGRMYRKSRTSQAFVGFYYQCKLFFFLTKNICRHTLHIKINALQKKYGHLYNSQTHSLHLMRQVVNLPLLIFHQSRNVIIGLASCHFKSTTWVTWPNHHQRCGVRMKRR